MCIFLSADELRREIMDVHLLLTMIPCCSCDVNDSPMMYLTVNDKHLQCFFFYFINGVSIHNTCWNQLYLPCSNLYLIQTTWMLLFKAQCTKSIKNVCRQYFVIHKRCGSRALICLSSKEDLHIFIQSKIFYMFVPHIPCWKCSAWTGMFHLSTSCPFFLSCSRIFHALPI